MSVGRGGNSHQSETNLNQKPLKQKPPRLFFPSSRSSSPRVPRPLEGQVLAGW